MFYYFFVCMLRFFGFALPHRIMLRKKKKRKCETSEAMHKWPSMNLAFFCHFRLLFCGTHHSSSISISRCVHFFGPLYSSFDTYRKTIKYNTSDLDRIRLHSVFFLSLSLALFRLNSFRLNEWICVSLIRICVMSCLLRNRFGCTCEHVNAQMEEQIDGNMECSERCLRGFDW